jgi:hypothetical protein
MEQRGDDPDVAFLAAKQELNRLKIGNGPGVDLGCPPNQFLAISMVEAHLTSL